VYAIEWENVAKKMTVPKDSTPSQNSPLLLRFVACYAPPVLLTTRTPAFVYHSYAGTPEEAILAMHDAWKDMFVLGLPWRKNPSAHHRLSFPGGQCFCLRLSGKRELVQLNRSSRPADALEYGAERPSSAKTTASWAESSAPLPCWPPTSRRSLPIR